MRKTLKHWIFSAIIVYATVFSVFTIKGCKEPNQKDRKHRLKRIQPESERKGLSQDTTNLKAALEFEYDHSSKEFRGSTNLPDNTKLIIVINDSKGFIDESFVLFTKRNFFSYKLSGEDNFTGKKNIELLTYFNHSWQSPEVLKKLNGLSGSLIKNNDGEKYIRIKQSVVFPIEQSPFERSQKAEKKKDKYIFDMRGNLVLKLKETSPPLTDRKSNALTKIENDSDCLKWRIIEDTYGATTEDSLDKLAEYTQTKEYNLVEKMLNRGELIMLKKGETVYLEDYKFLSGAAKIRVANTQIILIVVNEMIKQNCTLQ